MVASKTASVKDSTLADITANEPLIQSFFVGSLKNTLDTFFAQLLFDGYEVYHKLLFLYLLVFQR